MPAATRQYPADVIVRARRKYVEGRQVDEIILRAGTNSGTFYKWLAGDVPGMELSPIPRRRPGVRRLRPTKSMRVAVVKRLWHAAEQQVREIEQRLASHAEPAKDRDRDTRSLSLLVRTLKELAALDENDERKSAKPEPDTNDDDDVRDIDEFRRDLARQMDAIIAGRAARVSGNTETP